MTHLARRAVCGAFILLLVAGPAGAVENLLANPGFEDIDPNLSTGGGSPYGDYWGNFGATDFNAFWGTGNAHASLFGDWFDNTGGIFQQGIAGEAGVRYQFTLYDVRIESSFDADLYLGVEYYAADDATKLGETLALLDTAARLANAQTDNNNFTMQGTAVPGTVWVRPIVRFDNVNPDYFAQSQANVFPFGSFFSVAPWPGDEYLKNGGFEDVAVGGPVLGDYWGKYGNADFNAFFGAGNAHASFFADNTANSGGVYQQAILGEPGKVYRFDLEDTRIEANFNASLYYGFEYFGDNDFTKLGESIALAPAVTGDNLAFSMLGRAVAGTKYVRPIVRFDSAQTNGGSQRNAFVFECSMTEVVFANLGPALDGPDAEPTPGAEQALRAFDFDEDGDVDVRDVARYQDLL